MRTTLVIDDDVLAAARDIASGKRQTIGQVVSDLARRSLAPKRGRVEYRNGVPLLPLVANPKPVTLEMVNALRDDDF